MFNLTNPNTTASKFGLISIPGWVSPEYGNGGGIVRPRYNPLAEVEYQNNGGGTIIGTKPTSGQCSCFAGTAYLDSQGNCACTESNNTTPIKVIDQIKNGQTIYYTNMPTTQNPLSGITDFISNNPLIAGGIALGVLFLLSKKGK